MSNFFEQELRKLFEDGEIIGSPRFMGLACIGTLGGNLRARAEFIPRGTADNCDALYLTVLNRTDGELDRLTLRFEDIWGKTTLFGLNNVKRIVSPHFWNEGGKMSWCDYQPTAADYQALRQAAGDYLGMFRERIPERTLAVPNRKISGQTSERGPNLDAPRPLSSAKKKKRSRRKEAKR